MMTKSWTISRTWQLLFTLLISIVGIASMIGSGGSGGSAATPPESVPPLAAITFPPPVSSTDGMTLTVTGTASDATGVMGVSVNGVDATTTDNFATWRAADVPLTDGSNTLTVSAVDDLGNTDTMADEATVHVAADVSGAGTNFNNGYAVALDSSRAFVSDFDSDELVSVNIDTGSTTGDSVIISSAAIGGGVNFGGPGGTVLVDGSTAALVTNWDPVPGELLMVDLVSGIRTIVSGGTRGVGPILFGSIGAALVDATTVLITNSASDELMSVDRTSGDRSVFSAIGIRGMGPEFVTPEGVTMDTANNRALVTDSENNSLMAVNLENGDRTIISANGRPATPEVGAGPNFNFPIGVVLDSANNRALVVNNFSELILAVDLTTGASFGDRTIFSDTDTNQANGTGPVLNFASGIALDGKDTAFVSGGKLWAVELGSGDRVIVGD